MKKHIALIFSILFMVIIGLLPAQALAITPADQNSIDGQSIYYWAGQSSSACATNPATAAAGTVATTQNQTQNAKTIIGIAKTENLGQQGALIGLMVGIDESSLANLANTNVPISLSNPAAQGTGSSLDSVGIFQQRPIDDWSTIASGPAADSNQAAVYQIMTPAYAAEAFFGSPPGSNAPSALSKGLQNISGWQNMPPQVAAQQVQNPGGPNPGNLNYQNAVAREQPYAQSLLNQFWSSSPAVPLPVAFSTGIASATSAGVNQNTACTVSCNNSGVTSKGTNTLRNGIVCLAEQQLHLWESGQLKPGTNAYFKYTNNRSEEWCADFASWIYNQAGYPLGPAGSYGPSWDIPYVGNLVVPPQDASKFTYHSVASGYTPQPGDLAIHGNQHVNIVIKVSGSTITMIGGDQGTPNFQNNFVSEYSVNSPASDPVPITGYVSPN